ncbi:ABC transporter ATP-binding protein [Nocardioides halotolerans]|uniref:ABC transporter ATP-binding protein n=1 Tax=Nocardioides halotolerans TaxID=433660 RepID=UPI0004105E31|nr:ATP-binding cassette domain-containing protein [Nocardioides halotolerans]
MTSVLEFRGVNASYDGAVVLQDVTFAIDDGETVGLVGRNGAGKSTALLSVYAVPTVTGDIAIDGKIISGRRYEPAALGVCLVPQGKRILPNLTVTENLHLGRAAKRSGIWNIDTVFDLFPNLARGAKRSGIALSGGEQQMLAIGRALMANPRLLMLDEPTEGLAPVIIDQLVEALRKVQSGGTSLLLVEQRIGMIQQLATRYLALRKGLLVSEGGISDLDKRDVQEMIAL